MKKGKIVGLEGSFAVAEAVRLANADVIAAYPITPQTHIVDRVDTDVARKYGVYWLQEPKTMASKPIYGQENGFAK